MSLVYVLLHLYFSNYLTCDLVLRVKDDWSGIKTLYWARKWMIFFGGVEEGSGVGGVYFQGKKWLQYSSIPIDFCVKTKEKKSIYEFLLKSKRKISHIRVQEVNISMISISYFRFFYDGHANYRVEIFS